MSLNYKTTFGGFTFSGDVPDALLSSPDLAALYSAQLGLPAIDWLKETQPAAVVDRSNGETRSWWAFRIPGAPSAIPATVLFQIQRGTAGFTTAPAGHWQRAADNSLQLDASNGPVWVPDPAAPVPHPTPAPAPLPPIFGGDAPVPHSVEDVWQLCSTIAKAVKA